MKERWGNWRSKYAAVALTTVAGTAAYQMICWRGLSASDWGTWFGAVFTALAFGGTIFLADLENRRRRDRERNLAYVTAAGLQERLTLVQTMIEEVIAALDRELVSDHKLGLDRRYAESLHNLPGWTDEELQNLVSLPNNAAAHLAAVAGRVRAAIAKLMRPVASEEDAFHRWKPRLAEVKADLATTLLSLPICIRECQIACDALNRDLAQ